MKKHNDDDDGERWWQQLHRREGLSLLPVRFLRIMEEAMVYVTSREPDAFKVQDRRYPESIWDSQTLQERQRSAG